MSAVADNGFRSSGELSNTRVPENVRATVREQISGKANQAITSTHHTEYHVTALSRERGVKPGVFVEIFFVVVVPIQRVDFSFMFFAYRTFIWTKPEEKEVVVGVGGGVVVEVGGNERRVLDEGFPIFGDRDTSYDGFDR